MNDDKYGSFIRERMKEIMGRRIHPLRRRWFNAKDDMGEVFVTIVGLVLAVIAGCIIWLAFAGVESWFR